MMISTNELQKNEITPLATLYRSTLKPHNMFSKDQKSVEKYIAQSQKDAKSKGGTFICAYYEADTKKKESFVGALFIAPRDESEKGTHRRFRLSHLCVHKKYWGKGIGHELIIGAIDHLKHMMHHQKISTIKLEVHSNSQKEGAQAFYASQGFVKEGTLKNHYRFGESCNVWGMLLRR
jgi:ribosomal protein S18 acetylase RimI-like enzyme